MTSSRVWQGPYRDALIHVQAEKCSSCVFHSGNRMHLAKGRLADLIAANLDADSALTCHDTLEHTDRDGAVCRGFYDAYADQSLPLRLARTMGIVEEVPCTSTAPAS